MDHGKSQQKTQKLQPQPQPADGRHKDEEDSGACEYSRHGA